MTELHVTNIRKDEIGDRQTVLSADFITGRRRKTVWFRTNGDVSPVADPFLPIALIPAMRRNWPVVIEGAVSPALLEGADTIQEIMTGWYPKFHKVAITPSEAAPARQYAARSVGTFFSGGVDSFYTLQQHLNEINTLVFVHGMDIPLKYEHERAQIVASIRDLATQLNLNLIEVETNLRHFGQAHVSWPRAYFGAALASVGLMLEPALSTVHIAAANTRSQLRPEGSHPDTDPKWGNGAVEIIHDGLDASRFDKIRSLVEWPLFLSHVRVCYQRTGSGLNCGRCMKCLWTMMLLRATGYLEQVTTFANPLDFNALRLYPPTTPNEIDRFKQAIALLEERDADPEFRALLEEMQGFTGQLPLKGRISRYITRTQNYIAHRF